MQGRIERSYLPQAEVIVKEALIRLRSQYDVVVLEGAGSPAEVNLKDRDIVNMRLAGWADAPVILVADIDRGGVFASIVGTLEILTPEERDRVKGFIINKFRGDVSLLKPGLDWLEERTGKPVLGVIPYLPQLGIEDEDSASLDSKRMQSKRNEELSRETGRTSWISRSFACHASLILRISIPFKRRKMSISAILPTYLNGVNRMSFCSQAVRIRWTDLRYLTNLAWQNV